MIIYCNFNKTNLALISLSLSLSLSTQLPLTIILKFHLNDISLYLSIYHLSIYMQHFIRSLSLSLSLSHSPSLSAFRAAYSHSVLTPCHTCILMETPVFKVYVKHTQPFFSTELPLFFHWLYSEPVLLPFRKE